MMASMPILSGRARVAGIAGWPVEHSRSPLIHGFWLRRHGIDGAYVPLPIRSTEFDRAMRGLIAAGFAGANVTIPHKRAAFALCDSVDDIAGRIGAVNTLLFRGGVIEGTNSDGFGFLETLREHNVNAETGPALLLGAGGAARAIAGVLLAKGVAVAVCNRSKERAEALHQDLPALHVVPWSSRSDALRDHALLVNTTSLGMAGHAPFDLSLDRAGDSLVIADVVYVPLETPLLKAGRARGLRTVDGLGMLLHQARPGFASWFGIDPVVDDELRRFVMADLAAR
ncbi:MAG: shikimate dehydrogenase [Acetobacteraceae bacterium]